MNVQDNEMKTVTSISGGQSSAYVAANYPSDYNIFSLVRIEDINSKFPDKKIRQLVEDRIQKPFIGTAEDDMIIYTMLDLEQFLGKKIHWVSGPTYDWVIANRGGWLPNKLHRYCTTAMKIEPMCLWWAENIGEPVKMQIGYRANEIKRVIKMNNRRNADGLIESKMTFEKHTTGRYTGQNKWEDIAWQYPVFPMYDDQIYRDKIVEFWRDKPVRFAPLNNCVGCFHRNPILLKKMFNEHPNKMEWFNKQERFKRKKNKKATWRSDVTYQQIKESNTSGEFDYDDFEECDTGYCGL